MRGLIIIPALFLAGCDSGPQWENEQNELANELNATAPVVENPNVLSETDYLNSASESANGVNAGPPAGENTASPPDGGPN